MPPAPLPHWPPPPSREESQKSPSAPAGLVSAAARQGRSRPAGVGPGGAWARPGVERGGGGGERRGRKEPGLDEQEEGKEDRRQQEGQNQVSFHVLNARGGTGSYPPG